ncbi:hypothetical protein DRO35_00900 [Candidatus Bathyarchaeota archaeon]|nr:MAG: ArsR family transcriptional regulator [Candidatus Bathyarchaeota archaeon]RLI13239.1 MAG: hypothetical protein DRO35_00900 [Candidatus Bathyarchaeota archaeon]
MARRSQFEIYLDILKAVAEGKRKPTHIMYRANLSWTRLKKHLDFLIAQGLLKETVNDSATIFSLTEKGREVIGYYRRLERILYSKKAILPSEVYIQY